MSPTSLHSSPSTAADLSSPEHRDDAPVPAASRDYDHEDDVTSGSLELTSEIKKVCENINMLSKYGEETTVERSFGDETDVSLAANDDVKYLSETDAIQQSNDVRLLSDSDVVGERDSISIEKDKNVCDNDVSDQRIDDIEDAVVELKSEQSPSLSSELLVADEDGASDDTATVELAGDSVLPNIDELFRLSSGDVAENSCRSDNGNVSDCSERGDMETDAQHTSGSNCLPSVAQQTCISDSPAQVAEKRGSYNLITDSHIDMESYSVSTASSSYNHEFLFGQSDCSRVSKVEAVEPSKELNDNHDGYELTLSENQLEIIYNGSRKTITADEESKSEASVDTLYDRQSSFNGKILENSIAVNCRKSYSTTFTEDPDACDDTCLTLSAPGCSTVKVERLLLNAADDVLSSTSSKDSRRSSTSSGDVAEFVDGEKYCDSKMDDLEIADGLPSESVGDDATRLEEINSCSSRRVRSLGTADMTNDEDSSQQKCLASDVVCLHQLEPTDAEQAASPSISSSSAAAGSSRSLSPTLNDDTAAVQLNACSLDQTTTATCELTCASPNEASADVAPRLSTSSLSSSSWSLDSQTNILSLNGSGLEEQERTTALMHEDAALSETHADAPATSSQSSSSSSPSSSCLVHSYTVESQISAAESGEDRCESDSANEAVTEKRLDGFCYLSDSALSLPDPAACHDHARQNASTVQGTTDNADRSEHHLASPISDLHQVSDSEKEPPLLIAVSVAKQSGSEAPTATSVAGFEKDKECTADGTGQERNLLLTKNTSLEDDEPEKKAERRQDRQKYVDVSRKRPITEHVRRETVQTAVTDRAKDLCSPALRRSPPPSQLVTYFSGDGRDRDGDYSSRLEGDATETDSREADSDRKSFTTVSTLHLQPSATKDRLLFCTLNNSIPRNTRTRPISPTADREDRKTTAVKEKAIKNASISLPVTSGKPESSTVTSVNRFAGEKSESYDTGDRASTFVEGRPVTASGGRRDDVYVDVHSVASSDRVKALPVTEVYKDGKTVTRKSEDSDGSRRTSARNDMASRRPPAAVVNRLATAGQTSPRYDSDSSCFSGNVVKSPTTVSAVEKWQRGSEVENVAVRRSGSGGGSFTEVRNETNYFDKSKRSSERNTSRPHVTTATADNGDHRYSSLKRVRADEKERAVRQLQSFLSPLCQNANSLPRVSKPPVVNRNKANAQVMADLRDAPMTPKSRPSDDVIRDVRSLSTNENARRQKPCLQPLVIHQATASLSPPAGFHDANNNKQPSAARDVIKMSPTTRRSRGDQLSPWQQNQVLYDVTITLSPTYGSFRQPATGYDQNNQRYFARQLSSENSASRGAVPSHGFTANRAGVFRRSLSLPVVDRSEAFMKSSTAVWERDRVRLPQTVIRTSPPTRLKPSSPAPSALRDYQFDYRS